MNTRERGFLLLSSHLGNPERCPLTPAQMRVLTQRMANAQVDDPDKQLEERDLIRLGLGRPMAQRILSLLEDEELLDIYLQRGRQAGCYPITRVSNSYPPHLRTRLGGEASGCLWGKGDASLLSMPGVSLVGSRDICPENAAFAREVGYQAAKQGYVLVSGNARGADRIAQDSCLAAGGKVICVVADELMHHHPEAGCLYLSEDGFDLPFLSQRALSRNRLIHCLGKKTFVAQCAYDRGGTWDGTTRNLRLGWSPVFCYDDGSLAVRHLQQLGAELISMAELHNFSELPTCNFGLFDQ